MPYFFDSNIIIGYLFYHCDPLGKSASKRIEDKEPNHTGYTNYVECFGIDGYNGRTTQIIEEITCELFVVKEQITQTGLITFRQKFNPAKYKRTGKILCQFLEAPGFSDPVKEKEINEVIYLIEKIYLAQKQKILDPTVCTWHSKRPEPYSHLQKTLAEKIENTNDIEVLLDAYHAAQKISGLVFITADKNDILSNKTHILQTLNKIKDITPP